MRPIFFSLSLFLALAAGNGLPVLAQSELKRADILYQNYDYVLAVQGYLKVLEKKEPTMEIAQKLAHAYRLMNDTKNAEFWYSQVLTFPEHEERTLLFCADAARRNGKYTRAKELYLAYAAAGKDDALLAHTLAASCDQALQWMASPEPVDVTKDSLLNSPNSDFSPVYFEEGLLFTSDRAREAKRVKGKAAAPATYGWTGRPFLQLYYARKNADASWSDAVALDPVINTPYHNATAIFSPTDHLLYFTRTNMVKEKQKDANTDPTSWVEKPGRRKYVNRLEIFTVERQGKGWGKPKPFAYNKPAAYSVGHPALSPDGQVLYFVSDVPGGFGSTDIYYCLRQSNGTWGKPVNAGKDINTPGKECFPTVDASGILYFASDGHPGMGGLDVFSVRGVQGAWKEVTNLKYPFNSSKDDFGIIYDSTGEEGYLASNRDNDLGIDNLYRFKPAPMRCNLAGRAVEKVMGKQGNSELAVDKVLIRLYKAGDTTAIKGYSDAKGNFAFSLLEGVTYTIKATKDGYLTRSVTFTPDCKAVVDMQRLNLGMVKNEVNRPYVIDNIYYDLDKYEIREDAKPELDKVVSMMHDNPRIRIELSSHTDSRHKASYNLVLSQLRAESAVRYIVSRGVDINRIAARGYGETKLLNRCNDGVPCSEEAHQLNRRTEFRVLETGMGKVIGKR